MKKYIIIFSAVLIIIMICCSKDNNTEKPFTEIPFTTYKHYFIKNTFNVDTVIGNFFVMYDTASFNEVFGAAVTMDTIINWIYPSYFNDSMVIVVVKDCGYNKYDLSTKKINRNNGIIRVDYDYKLIQEDMSYSRRSSSIVMIEKQSWDKVNFYENGEFIKQVTEPYH